MAILNDTFTSTGAKYFWHQETMKNLRNGKGQCIVTHVMATDVCAHFCAFCSVQARAGDVLPFDDIMAYLDILLKFGLKATILSGGGNPILYRCKKTGKDFNALVDAIHAKGLEIGLISDGMPLKEYEVEIDREVNAYDMRRSWKNVHPETLDKLTWIRISMAGLDHVENDVYVPDIDLTKTTLGFSYVAHDVWTAPEDPHHGKVSTEADLLSLGVASTEGRKVWRFEDRIETLTGQIEDYVARFKPKYVRMLPNCLEPNLIPRRCEQLERMAKIINFAADEEVAFVQQKPPKAPHACFLGYIHPVLNCDGYVYPCDSCVLNETANHSFANPWRICHWSEIASIYEKPVRSLIADPTKLCPGCVFTRSNEILGSVVDGTADITPPSVQPEHVNFV
jgi:Radical SAM superfamily